MVLELDRKNFEEEVLKGSGYIFVDFFGNGCVPCAALKPHYDAYAEKYGDKLKFTCLNTSSARRVAIGQQIMGLPVVAVYKDGEKLEELVKDDATPEAVEELIKKYHEQA
ncbi:MAG: thioredoxin domain-containing protein [Eubacteriales bacterium]|nr:thioredoxin domain-containing protein [Eubacteriales bacterium]